MLRQQSELKMNCSTFFFFCLILLFAVHCIVSNENDMSRGGVGPKCSAEQSGGNWMKEALIKEKN